MGKLLQALIAGARVVAVDGNFDAALRIVRELAARDDHPITLVNSINPDRLAGQKTAAFEVCDDLGRAPDVLAIPVGNAGNISAYWAGFRDYRDGRADRGPAPDVRLPGRRRGADRARSPGGRARDGGDGDPDRRPGQLDQGDGRPRRIGRPDRGGDRRRDPGRLSRPRPARGRVLRAVVGGRRRRHPPARRRRAGSASQPMRRSCAC